MRTPCIVPATRIALRRFASNPREARGSHLGVPFKRGQNHQQKDEEQAVHWERGGVESRGTETLSLNVVISVERFDSDMVGTKGDDRQISPCTSQRFAELIANKDNRGID
ncbi:unnamed protein product [Toxocara canis]|uniref:Uncharacterized protein n=1 Tax=Toxocara canis TaxID=6265 RepID=A0A183V8K4_TOXCA|nr:unnamed protein product [Toxocara canis]